MSHILDLLVGHYLGISRCGVDWVVRRTWVLSSRRIDICDGAD